MQSLVLFGRKTLLMNFPILYRRNAKRTISKFVYFGEKGLYPGNREVLVVEMW